FGPTFIYYLIGITVAFFGTALLTYLFGLGETDETTSDNLSVALPLRGDIIPLGDVNDPVFSTLAMGNGFAIYPETGDILAPITGEIITVFPTGHAFGIRSALGTELLVHIGLNTVDLSKGTFNISVKKGDKVKKGQQIGTVNLAEIKEKNYDPTTMVIFTNGVKEQTLVVLDQSKNDITSVISKDAIEKDGK
ncbi:MAG: PTS glucose transporter subunit IIA, partial [Lactococcus sp.]|nr:PTS glucose transporter subunit IIA [Lactococcus sp.]